ncbi:MBL fold metallo-hydrolase [Enterovirga sp.]|uniref:MBL fold metallo-hydrolase n=1 Tax=Enterovirga sp. TaxID=2026350 RepID=UPI0026176C42|nr:MBL fold metallo-hydrolase [Enterovirga sp.]MDB5591516.1 fold metallo-hydrolase [Enterovirga sp.]
MRPIRPICITCGTQYEAAQASVCPVCEDERQWVRWEGQAWTDLAALAASHTMRIADDHGVLGLDVVPAFAIGQRALLVETPAGNLLWDCVALLNAEAIAAIRDRGGLAGIAISHPHYYTTMLDWSAAFGGVPIHLHADDAAWIQRSGPAIQLWQGETTSPLPGLTLIRCGGHFEGATVLHRAAGAGDLFVGDVLQVGQDRRSLSFMRSYPNFIPVNAGAVRRIAASLAPFRYGRVHGAFRGRSIAEDGEAVVARSVERYLAAIS